MEKKEQLIEKILTSSSSSNQTSQVLTKPKDPILKTGDAFKRKKQLFQVQHIKEKITIYIDSRKRKYRTLFKCVYCGEIAYSINRFNSHMRKHVRNNNIIKLSIFLFI